MVKCYLKTAFCQGKALSNKQDVLHKRSSKKALITSSCLYVFCQRSTQIKTSLQSHLISKRLFQCDQHALWEREKTDAAGGHHQFLESLVPDWVGSPPPPPHPLQLCSSPAVQLTQVASTF